MSFLTKIPDISILSRDLRQQPGLPLVVILRNELTILPDFLDHYRRLGVKRFFALDDQSDDGTREFLFEQNDVCLLASRRRYGDPANFDDLPESLRSRSDLRLVHAWRTFLMSFFVGEGWALQCDADEFLMLPKHMNLPELIVRLEASGARGAWGGMIDLYPASITDLDRYPPTGFVHPKMPWYYDGKRHFSINSKSSIRHHYCGVRHRLETSFLAKPSMGLVERLRLRILGRNRSPSGMLMKPIVQKWDPTHYYLDSHRTSIKLSTSVLLPLLHYRYTPAMIRKLKWAVSEGGYSKGGADYKRTEALLATMLNTEASFLDANSVQVSDFNGFVQTGNAKICL